MLIYKIFNRYTKEVYKLVTFSVNTSINELCIKLDEIKKQYKDANSQLVR